MKKKLLSRHVAMLVMALVPLLSPAVNTIIYNATYDFNELTLGTDTLSGVTYTTINYEGLFNGGDPGKPSLPIDYVKLSVPYNASNFTVTATLQNNVIQTLGNLDQLVYPCQPARMMNDTTPVVIVPPDSSVYFSSSYYPGQNAWVVDEGFLAGENHIVTIAVMPVSYMHNKTGAITTNKIKKSHTVRLTLSYDLSDNPAMSPIIRQDTTLRQEGYALTRSMVANPSNVLANAPIELSIDPMDIVNPNSGDGLNGGGVDPPGQGIYTDSLIHDNIELDIARKCAYLIVTTPELKHSLRRLAALKRQKGYTVKIVTMDDVLNDSLASLGDRFLQPDGTYIVADSSYIGVLRQYLKNAFNKWGVKYVLFAGDSVPYRRIKYYYGDEIIHVPTDLYYSDLNTYWCEQWYLHPIDKDPELFVGRILAKNSSQIMNYTDKLFRYELNPGKGNRNYLRRILYTEAIDFEKYREWEMINNSYKKVFSDSIRILEVINGKYPSGTEIVNALNTTNVGYISVLNHAAPYGFITYGHRVNGYPKDSIDSDRLYYLWAVDSIHTIDKGDTDNSDPHILNGLNNLTNKWYPNICYSSGCTTMPFDSAPDYENIDISFGEHFIIGRDYGGPAFLGNTRRGFFGRLSTGLEQCFADQLHDGYTKVGKAEALSKFKFNRDVYTDLIHNLLGEPEFDIWTDIPQQLNSINIIRREKSTVITNIDSETKISFYNNGGQLRVLTASSDTTIYNVSPNSTIMFYRHNYLPYIAPLILQNAMMTKDQYVIAGDVTAGNSVDNNRDCGDVIIKDGVTYEIEANGTIILNDGFEVEKGGVFAIYPSCY